MPDAYRSACPIACTLDVLGDRWTLVVMRDVLLKGHHSFSEIGGDEGIATNVLAERLERLTSGGLLRRERDPQDGRRRVYLPTETGIALIPLLTELVVWGDAHTPGRKQAEFAAALRHDRAAVIAKVEALVRERIAAFTP